MRPRLTLVFLCDRTEQHSLFISALVAADFKPLTVHRPEQVKRYLSTLTVDAVVIQHPGLGDITALTDSLKRIAPRTPILRLNQSAQGPQPGVDAAFYADLQDEVLTHAVATFLRHSITGTTFHRAAMPVRKAGFLAPNPQPAM